MSQTMSVNKHNIIIFLFALLILSHSSLIAARYLLSAPNLDEKEVGSGKISATVLLNDNGLFKLTSSEAYCEEGDDEEDCQKRRMTAEAHLDYIYTQHHKDSTTIP